MIQDGDNFSESVCEEEVFHDYILNRQDKLADKLSKIQKEKTLIHDDINFYDSITSKKFKILKENYGAEIAEEVVFFASLLNQARDAQAQDLISSINRDFGLELKLKFEYEDFKLSDQVLPDIYYRSESKVDDDWLSSHELEEGEEETFRQNINLYLRSIDVSYSNLCSKFLLQTSVDELNVLLDLKDYLNYIKYIALKESGNNLKELKNLDHELLFTLDETIDSFIRLGTDHYEQYVKTKINRIVDILNNIDWDCDSKRLIESIKLSSNKIYCLIFNASKLHKKVLNVNPEIQIQKLTAKNISLDGEIDIAGVIDEEELDAFKERSTVLGFYTNQHQVKFYRILNLLQESSNYPDEVQIKFVSLYRDIIKYKIGLKKYIENEINRSFNRKVQMREVLDPIECIDLFFNIDQNISIRERFGFKENEYREFFKAIISKHEYFLLEELLELCLNSIATDFYEINNYTKTQFGHELLSFVGEVDEYYYSNHSLIKNFEIKEKLSSKNYSSSFQSLKNISEEYSDERALEALRLQQSINRYYEFSSLNRANQDIFDNYGFGDLSPFKEEIGFYTLIDLLILNLPSELSETEEKINSLIKASSVEIKQKFKELVEASKKLSHINKLSSYYELLKNYSIIDKKIVN